MHYVQGLCQCYGVSEKGHGSSLANTGRGVDEGGGSLLYLNGRAVKHFPTNLFCLSQALGVWTDE